VVYSEEDELEDDDGGDVEMGSIKVSQPAGGGGRRTLFPNAEAESPLRKSQVKTNAGGSRREVVTIEESSDSDNQTFRGTFVLLLPPES
jgi:hypothetical protein